MKLWLYVLSAVVLLLVYVLCRFIVTSKLGRVIRAMRDHEGKARAAGYDPLRFKLFVWTLSAVLCGLAGALYAPQVGIINPSEMQPANSIEMAIWVAVGGRGTLLGAAAGAILVNGAKSWFTGSFPDVWLYFLGALFIVITLFLPGGFASLFDRFTRKESAS
jgi:urea transport system permease protein